MHFWGVSAPCSPVLAQGKMAPFGPTPLTAAARGLPCPLAQDTAQSAGAREGGGGGAMRFRAAQCVPLHVWTSGTGSPNEFENEFWGRMQRHFFAHQMSCYVRGRMGIGTGMGTGMGRGMWMGMWMGMGSEMPYSASKKCGFAPFAAPSTQRPTVEQALCGHCTIAWQQFRPDIVWPAVRSAPPPPRS